jgi:hypothetical protein
MTADALQSRLRVSLVTPFFQVISIFLRKNELISRVKLKSLEKNRVSKLVLSRYVSPSVNRPCMHVSGS